MLNSDALIEFQAFFLIFVRTIATIGLLPLLGARVVPIKARIGIAGVIAYALSPLVYIDTALMPASLPGYMVLAMQETMAGLIMGFAGSFLFIGVQAAGQLLGLQMGLSMGQVIDPQMQTQVSPIGQVEYTLAMLAFLAWDGHHFFITALKESFDVMPVATIPLSRLPVEYMVELLSAMFLLGIKISAPVMITLLMTTLLLGLIARVTPRMNVFILSFPLSIGVGLLTLGLSLEPASRLFNLAFLDLQKTMAGMMMFMGK